MRGTPPIRFDALYPGARISEMSFGTAGSSVKPLSRQPSENAAGEQPSAEPDLDQVVEGSLVAPGRAHACGQHHWRGRQSCQW